MRLELPFTPPYDWVAARRLVGAHAVTGSEVIGDDGSVTRLLDTPSGPVPVSVTVGINVRASRSKQAEQAVVVATVPDEADPSTLVPTLRHWLDLDLDPADVLDGLETDPTIGPLVTANPGLRRIGYPTAFDAVVLTVLGQQVSLAAGRTFAGRLVAAYGVPGPAGLTVFPRAERLAALEEGELRAAVGLTGARTRTVLAVARAFADDPDLVRAGPQSPAERDAASARLLALPGIGPWTVDYLRMRLLADPDALPSGDLVLRKAAGGMTAAEVELAGEAWRPWRTYAVLHLWSTMAWA